ncbi:MAG: peptide ABC transporter permease [Candidatus Rokuibacteriota bacterium]|nr:MAG: peptide ABC transporter permease [Candidatus Rokubacteria bacterium]
MRRYVVGRVLQALVALLGVTCVAFLLVSLSGDPAFILLTPEAGEEQRAAFRKLYGLDQPLPVQYARYVSHVARGDFGSSFAFNRPAIQVVLERLPATLLLTATAVALGVVVGMPAGIAAAVKASGPLDRLVMALVLLGQSVPTFWLGLLMIRIFAVNLRWVPVSGHGTVLHLVMPAVALGLYLAALLARLTRSEMLEALAQDYVRTARAKGLSERVVTVAHALKNALLPIVTLIGLQLGALLGGAVVTETVFAWPGIGSLVLDAILRKDYPVVLAAVEFVAAAFIVINMALDLLYGYLDPRLRTAQT